MFNHFLQYLERHGRKYVMISEQGEILVEKFMLWGEREGPNADSPYLALHHFVYLGRDQLRHSHRGNFISLILKGWYLEATNDGSLQKNTRGSVIRMQHTDYHDIREVGLNTWTLFLMGPTRSRINIQGGDGKTRRRKDVWHKVGPDLEVTLQRIKQRYRRISKFQTTQ